MLTPITREQSASWRGAFARTSFGSWAAKVEYWQAFPGLARSCSSARMSAWGHPRRFSAEVARARMSAAPQHQPKSQGVARRREGPLFQTYASQRKRRHSIISLARARSIGGMVRPSASAVLKLITSSKVIGYSTGRVAGSSPLRMRRKQSRQRVPRYDEHGVLTARQSLQGGSSANCLRHRPGYLERDGGRNRRRRCVLERLR